MVAVAVALVVLVGATTAVAAAPDLAMAEMARQLMSPLLVMRGNASKVARAGAVDAVVVDAVAVAVEVLELVAALIVTQTLAVLTLTRRFTRAGVVTKQALS